MDPTPSLELSVGSQPTRSKAPSKEFGGAEVEEKAIEELRTKILTLNEENRRLSENLNTLLGNYVDLKRQSEVLIGEQYLSRKRKKTTATGDTSRDVSDVEEKRFSKMYVKLNPLDTANLGVEDGYQWRKYGQKVTRDNPYPRAYFKCSFHPSCPVKKKVQRSLEDRSLLVAIYEGEHNHPPSSVKLLVAREVVSCNSASSPPTSLQPEEMANDSRRCDLLDSSRESQELCSLLAEKMATRLASDPNFTQQLASLIVRPD